MDIEQKLAEFERAIDKRKKTLLDKQKELLTFVDSDHKAKATEAYQHEVRLLAKQVNDFLIDLIETKESAEQSKDAAQKLCEEGMGLNGLARDMLQALANDLAQRQKKEDFDAVKNIGVIAALAVTAVTLSKPIFDPDSSHAAIEATVGASVGIWLSFRKQIMGGFCEAAKAISASPRKVRDSFLVYYLKETTKGMYREFVKPIENENSFVLLLKNDRPRTRIGKNENTLKVA